MKSAAWAGFFLLCAGLAGGDVRAAPRDVIEPIGDGQVNWSRGTLTARGSGGSPREAKNIAQARLMAERAALADARGNLLETLKGVRVDSKSQIEDYMIKSDEIRLRAEGFIQRSTEVKDARRYLSDGAIEVTVVMDLRGDLLKLLLAPARVEDTGPPKSKDSTEREGRAEEHKAEERVTEEPPKIEKPLQPVPAPLSAAEKKDDLEQKPLPPGEVPPYTGLVVDSRGTSPKPALVPKIVDENGRDLYPGSYASPEKAAQNGLALYTRDLTSAQINPRVGKNPLTITASKNHPSAPAEIILSGRESEKVLPFARQGTFLEECKVIIVLD